MRRVLSLWLTLAMLLSGSVSTVCAADPDAVSPLASYIYLDTLADPPSQPNVVNPLVSYLYQDSLATPPDQPNVVSPLVSYLYYDWPGDENLIFQNSPLVSYFFTIDDGPPFFVSQPHSQFVQAGSPATFGVLADGQPPLNYQWRFNGQNISGATSPTLTLNSVTAAKSGGYSVRVSNAYGSVASPTAYLSILADGANGNSPEHPAAPFCPAPSVNVDSLILVTHGWELGYHLGGSALFGNISWITNMADAIRVKAPGWEVRTLDWTTVSQAPIPLLVADLGIIGGHLYGSQLRQQRNWRYVHLIGHSAGSGVIEGIAAELKSQSNPPIVHETFLDPYVGPFGLFKFSFGSHSDWSDSYFAQNLASLETGGRLPNCYNVDVTWTDPHAEIVTKYCPFDSEFFSGNAPCGQQASSSHGWPHDFYFQTIEGTETNCAQGYGFALSKEAMGNDWLNNPTTKGPNNQPIILCDDSSFVPSLPSSRLDLLVNFDISPHAISGTGVTIENSSRFKFDFLSLPPSPKNHLQNALAANPLWLAVGVTITNPVNFIQFAAEFTSTNAQGLLTIYWNTNQIGIVDERAVSPGLQNYRFALPEPLTSGLYTLSFRLDAFNDTAPSITVTNVATGFIGNAEQPTLEVHLATNGIPVLKLNGTAGYDYLLQSSTNFVDWQPIAILANTNGTMLFFDSTATNSYARFYRAALP